MFTDTSVNSNKIITDRFSNPESEKMYNEQWATEPATYDLYMQNQQCGGCSFFAPFNQDWGLCCHAKSRHHLETVFEHFVCPDIADEGWGAHSFLDFKTYPELRRMYSHFEIPEEVYDEVEKRAKAKNPDEHEAEMYWLILGVLKRAFKPKK